MNIIRSFSLLTSLCVIAAALTFSGCASSGTNTYKKSETAADSILSAGNELDKGITQIDATLAALDSLVNQPAANLTAQYQNFVKQFSTLEKQAASADSAAKSMRAKADSYLATWGTQVAAIQNPELRAAALDRRGEVSAELQKVVSSYSSTAGAYQPFIKSLQDIKQVLGADLTTAGLNAVKPYASKATAAATPLKQSIESLIGQFQNLSTALKPLGPVSMPAQ